MTTLVTDWSTVQEDLRSWVADLSGLPTYWRDDGRVPQFSDGAAHALLHIQSTEEIGGKNVFWDSGPSDTVVPKSDRLLRLSLEVSVRAGWSEPGTLAAQSLSLAAAKAQLPALPGAAEDAATELPALSDAGPIVTVDYDSGNWVISQATATWTIYLRDIWQDTDVSVERIVTVDYTPDIET